MGLESFFIQYTGKVYLANCLQGGTLGDINKPSQIVWPTSSVICKRKICFCATDVLITKEKMKSLTIPRSWNGIKIAAREAHPLRRGDAGECDWR